MGRPSALRLIQLGFLGIFFGVLVIPLIALDPDSEAVVWIIEHRHAAALPALPDSLASAEAWPAGFDAYLSDHFGGRPLLVRAFNGGRYRLFGEGASEQAVFGPTGRLYLTTNFADRPYSWIGQICGVGFDDASVDRGVSDLAAFGRRALTPPTDRYTMIVPTAPVLYPRDMPDWLQRACSGTSLVDRLLARLPPSGLRDRPFYPLPELLAAERNDAVIPLTNFHWDGIGPETAVAAFAEKVLGMQPLLILPTRRVAKLSDIDGVIPGIATANAMTVPDYDAAGIDYCFGVPCFPELPEAGVIRDLSRLDSPAPGGRKLLILSDSFGRNAVGWFAAYFHTVRHFSVSNLGRLSPAELADFRHFIYDDYQPDVVLYLFADGSALYWPAFVADLDL